MGVDGREEPRGSDGTDETPPLHKVPGQGGPPGLPAGSASAAPNGPSDDPSVIGLGSDVGAEFGARVDAGVGGDAGVGAGSAADSDPLELWSGAFGSGVPQQRDGGWLGGDPGTETAPGTGAEAAGFPAGSDPCTGGSAPTDDAGAQDDADADVPPSDLELVTRLRGGESSDAYEELYRRHADAVRRYARTCCRDDHTAEDLTNEVFTSTLQAVRRGAGPDSAVRAYLLTTVRRVAAAWAKTAKREQLVEDFAVFATSSAAPSLAADDDTLGLGADVRAMQEAEESLAVQAFRSLPERWQTVLWHTTVEEESPSEVAPLLGLSANATAVLAHRAREGLKQAYLQAHVSSSLTSGGDCAQYADRLGAYARGRLRTRAERGMRKHLEECARCRSAALEVADVNERLRALLPVAVIGWFAAGWSVKAAAGLAAGAGAAVGGGSGGGGVGGPGAAATSAGSGTSTASGSAGLGGEGLGVPAKIGLTAGALAAAGAVVAYALAAGAPAPAERPRAARTAVAPVVPAPPAKPKPSLTASPAPTLPPSLMAKAAAATPTPQKASPSASPAPPSPTPEASRTPAPGTAAPLPAPVPAPATFRPKPKPKPTLPPPPPARPSAVFPLNELEYGGVGDGKEPEVRLGPSSWLWQRYGMRVGGTAYRHGVSMHAQSSVTIDLNRSCTSYDALVGVDDMTLGLGTVTFSVFADGTRLWSSGPVRAGTPAVAVHAPLAGHKTLRLAVEPLSPADRVAVADWATARISCAVNNKPPVADR
ncbi:sigma-70 family RNA polymerase sigma factor [Streptomyces sp. SCA3-4]|uniref:sigma-70 family RNA polymerase sigma factor n=1 Tax=Streptomyces sichuanensis TaxID=2871810 RepID=UPI001CE34BFC|nr:sigma-70 family RNA polymerase sigma factor [Streptomyces sichuanensis]MCA6095570.1 sigma-70 family RNA polymerase sigma factor [Streptomyces sichuanensis]